MKKIIISLFIILSFAITVHGANPDVLDSSVYYGEAMFYNEDMAQISTIESGDITGRYSVINSESESNSCSVICALYEDGVLTAVSSQTKELAPLESKVFEFVHTVPADCGKSEIRAFLVRDLSVRTPLKSLASLSAKSNEALVTGFSLNGIEGEINDASNLIAVTVPADSALTGIEPVITVSDGASYEHSGTDWDAGEAVTVTAANETKKLYTVRLKFEAKKYLFDFEDYEIGKTPLETDKNIWNMGDNEDDYNTRVAEENGNRILVLYDESLTTKTNGKTRDIMNCSVPFRLTMKVRYALPEGSSGRTAEEDFSYSPFYVRNGGSASMCGIQATYTSNKFWFNYMENGSTSKRTEIEIVPGEWYDIEMYYYLADDGKYYTDYTFTDDSGKSNVVSKIPSGLDFTESTTLYFSTSNGRRCVVSYDDICLEEVKNDSVSYSNSFDEGVTDGITGGEIGYCPAFESDALVINGTAGYSADAALSFETGFKFSADSLSDGITLAKLKGEDSECAFRFKDGVLYYSFGDTETVITSVAFESGASYDFTIDCVYDEAYKNIRLDLYVNGELKANLPWINEAKKISSVEFSSGDGEIYIDDFYINN